MDNNISLFTRPFTFYQMTMSDGFYNHHSANVIFAHNLAYGNAGFGFRCLLWGGDDHSNPFGPYTVKVSHNRVLNNIAYANARGAVALPVDQKFCWSNLSDRNLFWGAASAPLFQLQRGTMAPSKLIAMVENGLKQHKIDPQEAVLLNRWENGSLGPNVGDMRHAGPLVGLPLWKALTGRDAHSVVGPLPRIFAYADGRLVLHLKPPDKPEGRSKGETEEVVGARPQSYADLRAVQCTRLPYIKYDYFGKPRPADRPPTVGPIQNLPEMAGGEQPVEILLWPNVSPARPPAIEAKISMERESVAGEWEK